MRNRKNELPENYDAILSSDRDVPPFNLWTEPWIRCVQADKMGSSGSASFKITRKSISEMLAEADNISALDDPSPLIRAGILRLLVAILQAALEIETLMDLKAVWRNRKFPMGRIQAFGRAYAQRFDLFSRSAPFMQCIPGGGEKHLSVGYLFPEMPTGTEVTLYRHGAQEDYLVCPACAATGMLTIPAFAGQGGQGKACSINGTPPYYFLPEGKTLFETLAASLTTPEHQPKDKRVKRDLAWWVREPKVREKEIAKRVGYLHGLTFVARRMYLDPVPMEQPCSRCGAEAEWGVRTMIFQMGERRQIRAASWIDPLVAYWKTKNRKSIPIIPDGKPAFWVAARTLFAPTSPPDDRTGLVTPKILTQLSALGGSMRISRFRLVGVRMDKAKVFEWIDLPLEVSIDLRCESLRNMIEDALKFTERVSDVMQRKLRSALRPLGRKAGDASGSRDEGETRAMFNWFWSQAEVAFRELLTEPLHPRNQKMEERVASYQIRVKQLANASFRQAVLSAVKNGVELREQERLAVLLTIDLAKLERSNEEHGGKSKASIQVRQKTRTPRQEVA